jgi:hypothetical protein
MKNVFFCLTFTLVSLCSFAKSEKQSVVVPNSIETTLFSCNTTENVDGVVIKYVFEAFSCYANIYYNGVLQHTVQSFGYGETSFQAQANCYRNARVVAEAWITMQEESFLQN